MERQSPDNSRNQKESKSLRMKKEAHKPRLPEPLCHAFFDGTGRNENPKPCKTLHKPHQTQSLPMGEQAHEPCLSEPLCLAAADELVKDNLGAIGEIAKLRLPDDQRVRVLHRVTQLVT
jgi:hypothetical protein